MFLCVAREALNAERSLRALSEDRKQLLLAERHNAQASSVTRLLAETQRLQEEADACRARLGVMEVGAAAKDREIERLELQLRDYVAREEKRRQERQASAFELQTSQQRVLEVQRQAVAQ